MWCVLLVIQAMLVGVGRTDVHRKVGVLGVIIAPGMVILGVAGALVAANRPTGFNGVPVPPLQFLVVPLFDIAFFIAFVGLGIASRINAALAAMAKGLADKPWCSGSHFSLADIAVGCALGYLDFRFPAIDWRAAHPNLLRLHGKLAARQSFIDTAPPA